MHSNVCGCVNCVMDRVVCITCAVWLPCLPLVLAPGDEAEEAIAPLLTRKGYHPVHYLSLMLLIPALPWAP